MKHLKKILAMTGVILLTGMYLCTLIFAFVDNSYAKNLLMASIFCTIVVPVLLYAYLFLFKLVHKGDTKETLPPLSPMPVTKSSDDQIDTVIFDLGKVLVDYDWKQLLLDLDYDEETAAQVSKAVFLSDDWEEGDRGIRSKEEILASFIQNNPDYETQIREVFDRIGETIHCYPYTEHWLDQLKNNNYKLYFLSNYSESMHEQSIRELSFLSKMDGGYFSYQLKCMKPEPEIYKKLIKDYSLIPGKCVFIDDRFENISEAKAQGLNAILFTHRKEAIDKLRKMGVE